MHVVQAAIGDQGVTSCAKLAAEVHVFTGFQGGIESPRRLKGGPPDGHIAAAEPVHHAPALGVTPEPVIQALDPCRGRGGPAVRPGCDDALVSQDTDSCGNPVSNDFVIGVDEGKDLAAPRRQPRDSSIRQAARSA